MEAEEPASPQHSSRFHYRTYHSLNARLMVMVVVYISSMIAQHNTFHIPISALSIVNLQNIAKAEKAELFRSSHFNVITLCSLIVYSIIVPHLFLVVFTSILKEELKQILSFRFPYSIRIQHPAEAMMCIQCFLWDLHLLVTRFQLHSLLGLMEMTMTGSP